MAKKIYLDRNNHWASCYVTKEAFSWNGYATLTCVILSCSHTNDLKTSSVSDSSESLNRSWWGGVWCALKKNVAGWSKKNSEITAGWSNGPFLASH